MAARAHIMKAAVEEITAGSKRLHEYMVREQMHFHSHDPQFNIQLKSRTSDVVTLKGALIGVYSLEGEFFKFAHHLNHLVLTDEQTDFFNKLEQFGRNLELPELTEATFSLDPQMRNEAIAWRSMIPMKVYRNELDEIESIYSLKAIVSLVASAMSAKAYFVNDNGKFQFYIAIMEEWDQHQS